jgi:hypothetical protein
MEKPERRHAAALLEKDRTGRFYRYGDMLNCRELMRGKDFSAAKTINNKHGITIWKKYY